MEDIAQQAGRYIMEFLERKRVEESREGSFRLGQRWWPKEGEHLLQATAITPDGQQIVSEPIGPAAAEMIVLAGGVDKIAGTVKDDLLRLVRTLPRQK